MARDTQEELERLSQELLSENDEIPPEALQEPENWEDWLDFDDEPQEEEPEDPDATKIYRNFSNGYGAYNTDDIDPVDYADDTLSEEPQDLKGTDWGKVVLALVVMGLIGVGLAVAANVPACRVVLGELSEGALRVCKQNVRRNSLNARVTCVSVNALEPPASALWDFDIIACNPPYIPTGDIPGLDVSVRGYEPHMALDGGADGLDFYRAVTQKWKSALRLGGSLIFEVGIGQAPSVEDILARNGFEGIQTTADTQGIWRVVEGTVNR